MAKIIKTENKKQKLQIKAGDLFQWLGSSYDNDYCIFSLDHKSLKSLSTGATWKNWTWDNLEAYIETKIKEGKLRKLDSGEQVILEQE